MTLFKRATEQTQSEWIEIPEGLWRWQIQKPELAFNAEFQKWGARFVLRLTDSEKKRLADDVGDPPEGKQQSTQTTYRSGISLGYFKDGQYKSTKLIDFLAVAFGSRNQRRFRDWIATGGGPATTATMTEEQEIDAMTEWLGWWQELELYGSIKHEPDSKEPGKVWARFGGPLPVGSLPGQPEDEYQAFGLGKLRAMLSEAGPVPAVATLAAKGPRAYADVFPEDGGGVAVAARPVAVAAREPVTADDMNDLPF